MLLMYGFAVLRISIPGPTQNLTLSSVTCTVANVICNGNGVFKTFAGNLPFRTIISTCTAKKRTFEAFRPKVSSYNMFLCNNSDQTCFFEAFTSAGTLGRC